jgi:hypothetical protein
MTIFALAGKCLVETCCQCVRMNSVRIGAHREVFFAPKVRPFFKAPSKLLFARLTMGFERVWAAAILLLGAHILFVDAGNVCTCSHGMSTLGGGYNTTYPSR